MKRLTIFSLTCLFSVGAVFAQQGVTQCGVPTGQPKFPLLTIRNCPTLLRRLIKEMGRQ